MKAKGLVLAEVINNFREVANELERAPSRAQYFSHPLCKFAPAQVLGAHAFPNWLSLIRAAAWKPVEKEEHVGEEPKVLLFDIETAPLLGYVWGLWENNVALNQIHSDWHLLSWSAKWLGKPEILYMDQRNAKNVEDDKILMQGLWELLNEADVVITQNGKSFDSKKANARFILNGLPPPSPYKHIDTKILAKRHFAFTSNKLEYLTDKLCVKHKKMKSRKFVGFDLWRECLAGNIAAWEEMRLYNSQDVLSLEELYLKLAPWGTGLDWNPLRPSPSFTCQCGSTRLEKRGFNFSASGKFQRYQCKDCGAWTSANGASNNLLSLRKRASLKGP